MTASLITQLQYVARSQRRLQLLFARAELVGERRCKLQAARH
jgi:hypothetical protein